MKDLEDPEPEPEPELEGLEDFLLDMMDGLKLESLSVLVEAVRSEDGFSMGG